MYQKNMQENKIKTLSHEKIYLLNSLASKEKEKGSKKIKLEIKMPLLCFINFISPTIVENVRLTNDFT